MFTKLVGQSGMVRCSTCGGMVDASDEGRGLHLAWHAAIDGAEVLDLTTYEASSPRLRTARQG